MPSTITRPVATRVPHADVAALRQFADREATTVSAALARLVREALVRDAIEELAASTDLAPEATARLLDIAGVAGHPRLC